MPTVFVSFATAHRDLVEALADRLRPAGIDVWADWKNIKAGEDWVLAIERAIEGCDLFLLLVTREAIVSSWIDKELDSAVHHKRPIFPVVSEGIDLSKRMSFFVRGIKQARYDGSDQSLHDVVAGVKRALAGDDDIEDRVSVARRTDAPSLPDAFEQKVTVARPACFIVLVDCSHSMSQKLLGTKSTSKKQAVAETVNSFLTRLLDVARRPGGYRDLFHVAVLGYGLGPTGLEVKSLLPYPGAAEEMVPISRLNETWRRTTIEIVEVGDDRTEVEQPVWVEPTSNVNGHTVMATAFGRARAIITDWIVEHPESVPPIVLNLTDGDWTDGDPRQEVRLLQESMTEVGATVVFNCQLASTASSVGTLLFPAALEPSVGTRTRELFYLSSILPESMRIAGLRNNHEIAADARGLAVNVSLDDLVDFLSVGSRTRV